VIGFDIREKKIAELMQGDEATGELTGEELAATGIAILSRAEVEGAGLDCWIL